MEQDINRRAAIAVGAVAVASFGGQPALAADNSAARNASACARYLEAWRRRDLDAVIACMHPEVHFKAPNAETNGRDPYRAATGRFLGLVERVETRAEFVSGEGAMFAHDFICRAPIGVCPTAELVRFEDGLIRETEIFFDVRPFEAFARAQAAASAAP